MSIHYVNEHLITDEVTGEGVWAQNNETYKRIMIKTTPDAVRKLEDGTFEPNVRVICVHNCSLGMGCNTRISSTIREGAFAPKITVRTSSDTRYNSDIFVVALPYDGMIKPFQHDTNALHIFKSMIVKSDKFSIAHEDHNYRRCAYFIVRPHHEYLGNDGWYAPECDLVVTFAQSNRSRSNQNDGELTWTFKTVRVEFGTDGQYKISAQEETAPYDSFNPEDIKSAPICELVAPTQLSDDTNYNSNANGDRNSRDYARDNGRGGKFDNRKNGKRR